MKISSVLQNTSYVIVESNVELVPSKFDPNVHVFEQVADENIPVISFSPIPSREYTKDEKEEYKRKFLLELAKVKNAVFAFNSKEGDIGMQQILNRFQAIQLTSPIVIWINNGTEQLKTTSFNSLSDLIEHWESLSQKKSISENIKDTSLVNKMGKNKLKEMFEKMRNEASQYTLKNLNDKPTEAGTYTISIENVRSITPMTLQFDGFNWEQEGLKSALKDADGDITKISYYDKDLSKKNKPKM